MLDEVEHVSVPRCSLSVRTVHVVRSFGAHEATARLHSQPLVNCVGQVSNAVAQLTPPDAGSMMAVADGSCVVFHYNDLPAISAIRALRQTRSNLAVACLCSDIYYYSQYMNINDIVDVFIAPTEAHRRVLAYQLYKPVYVMPEAIDSVVPADFLETSVSTGRTGARAEVNKRVVWFGYAESFAKGMASVFPIIMSAEASGSIDGFTVITNIRSLRTAGLDVSEKSQIEYSTSNFFDTLRRSTYAILSHMPLDLELNSLIKSPNKLVTSLVCGLVPLCSDTPNYSDLLSKFGLQEYVFSSPVHFASMISGLDPERDSRRIQESGIIPFILEQFSQASVATRFVEIMDDLRRQPRSLDLPAMNTYTVPRTSSLREHLSDLLPSAGRLLRSRAEVARQRWFPKRNRNQR